MCIILVSNYFMSFMSIEMKVAATTQEKLLFVNVSYINKTQNYHCGESGFCETRFDNLSDLYKSLIREFGRCTGKMFVDSKNGKPQQTGWVFIKKVKYEDCKEYYLQEVWVEVSKTKPYKKETLENLNYAFN